MTHDFQNELATVKKKNDAVEHVSKEELVWRAQELKRCHDDIIYFANHYYRVISPEVNNGRGGLGVITTYPKQNDLLNFLIKYNRAVILAARQSGKSVSYSIFCLWKLCFYPSTSIMLLAQEANTAIDLLGKIRMAYEYLPSFLKPSVETYNKSSITFSNLSSMKAYATASQGARSKSANILIVDECAFVPNNIADDFMSAVYPTISRDPNAKVIFVSTPNGASDKNLFYHTWRLAGESDPNDIDAWQRFRMDWWDVPGRDEHWKDNQIKSVGIERFNREFGNEFVGSNFITLFANTIIEKARKERTKEAETELRITSMNDDFIWEVHCWERPKVGHLYIAGADISEGIGGDSSTLLIFDITDMSKIKLVLSFDNSNISITEFAGLCARILSCYNCPPLLCEDNGVSAGFLSVMNDHYKYSDILKFDNETLGIHSSPKNKMNACIWAKEAFNIFNIILADEKLINQMEVFSKTASKSIPAYAAIKGEHDDLTLSLIWALYLLKLDVIEKQNRYTVVHTEVTPLGTTVATHIIDSEISQDHFVSQFMNDPLKNELLYGNSAELQIAWWNSDDNVIIQSSRHIESPPPFYVINGYEPNSFDYDDEGLEFGAWN